MPHEFAHSFMAWILGVKYNPFLIEWGGKNISNLLLLTHIDENVNYFNAYLLGQRYSISLIAFAGPGIGTLLLYIISLYFLKKKAISKYKYLYYFIFLIHLVNLGELYAYVPIRALATHADIANINFGLNISPWWIFLLTGYPIIFALYYFFKRTLINTNITLNLISKNQQLFLLLFSTLYILGKAASVGLHGYGEITRLISLLSLFSIPCILYIHWPNHDK